MNGYDKVCSALLTLGADPNATNKISKTPLIYAAAEGHVKVLEELVKCPNIDLEAKGIVLTSIADDNFDDLENDRSHCLARKSCIRNVIM